MFQEVYITLMRYPSQATLVSILCMSVVSIGLLLAPGYALITLLALCCAFMWHSHNIIAKEPQERIQAQNELARLQGELLKKDAIIAKEQEARIQAQNELLEKDDIIAKERKESIQTQSEMARQKDIIKKERDERIQSQKELAKLQQDLATTRQQYEHLELAKVPHWEAGVDDMTWAMNCNDVHQREYLQFPQASPWEAGVDDMTGAIHVDDVQQCDYLQLAQAPRWESEVDDMTNATHFADVTWATSSYQSSLCAVTPAVYPAQDQVASKLCECKSDRTIDTPHEPSLLAYVYQATKLEMQSMFTDPTTELPDHVYRAIVDGERSHLLVLSLSGTKIDHWLSDPKYIKNMDFSWRILLELAHFFLSALENCAWLEIPKEDWNDFTERIPDEFVRIRVLVQGNILRWLRRAFHHQHKDLSKDNYRQVRNHFNAAEGLMTFFIQWLDLPDNSPCTKALTNVLRFKELHEASSEQRCKHFWGEPRTEHLSPQLELCDYMARILKMMGQALLKLKEEVFQHILKGKSNISDGHGDDAHPDAYDLLAELKKKAYCLGLDLQGGELTKIIKSILETRDKYVHAVNQMATPIERKDVVSFFNDVESLLSLLTAKNTAHHHKICGMVCYNLPQLRAQFEEQHPDMLRPLSGPSGSVATRSGRHGPRSAADSSSSRRNFSGCNSAPPGPSSSSSSSIISRVIPGSSPGASSSNAISRQRGGNAAPPPLHR